MSKIVAIPLLGSAFLAYAGWSRDAFSSTGAYRTYEGRNLPRMRNPTVPLERGPCRNLHRLARPCAQ